MIKTQNISVWVVDDSRAVLGLILEVLSEAGYVARAFDSAVQALQELHNEQPHVIISDIMMPELDGVSFLERIYEVDKGLPVILMTANPDTGIAIRALRFRAFDFIVKPLEPAVLLQTLRRAVESREIADEQRAVLRMMEEAYARSTAELREAYSRQKFSTIETIHVLTRASEFRDDDTSRHIARISRYSTALARLMGMKTEFCEHLSYASPMHDIGKIGVPDSILTKKAPLSYEEYEVMKGHTLIGSRILKEGRCPMLHMAEEIARCHHELFDGTGYPEGLSGYDIPVSARIVTLVDQYDALRSSRPYKEGLSHREAMRILTRGDGRTMPTNFDPDILAAFEKNHAAFEDIFIEDALQKAMDN